MDIDFINDELSTMTGGSEVQNFQQPQLLQEPHRLQMLEDVIREHPDGTPFHVIKCTNPLFTCINRSHVDTLSAQVDLGPGQCFVCKK